MSECEMCAHSEIDFAKMPCNLCLSLPYRPHFKEKPLDNTGCECPCCKDKQ
jgi:hypothetical protein